MKWQWLYKFITFLVGVFVGFWVNEFLSIEFLSNPNLISLIIGALTLSIIILLVFWVEAGIDWLEKLEIIFLGCWVASLILGFIIFVRAVLEYMPVGAFPPPIGIRAWVIVNMLKSLFLSGVFNVLERFVRLWRKD